MVISLLNIFSNGSNGRRGCLTNIRRVLRPMFCGVVLVLRR
jgi:hypothetical protein